MKERYRTDNVKIQFQRNKILLAFEENSEVSQRDSCQESYRGRMR